MDTTRKSFPVIRVCVYATHVARTSDPVATKRREPLVTDRIYLPDTFMDDWQPAREDAEAEAEKNPGGVIDRTLTKINAGTPARRGRGTGVWVTDLEPDEALYLHGEAHYRWEYNATNAYLDDPAEKNRPAGAAAARVKAALAPLFEHLDTSGSASRQHYIETGRYLTHAESAEACA